MNDDGQATQRDASALTIRLARRLDFPVMLDLWVESWRATFPTIDFDARRNWFLTHVDSLRAEGAEAICAFSAEKMQGFVIINGTNGYLDQLALHPRAFGSGVAQALIAAARKISPRRILLDVNSDNLRALTFYMREGFVATGQGRNPRSRKATIRLEWRAPS